MTTAQCRISWALAGGQRPRHPGTDTPLDAHIAEYIAGFDRLGLWCRDVIERSRVLLISQILRDDLARRCH
jgi:hypothetical protein